MKCKHCGRPISTAAYPVHLEGGYRGKQRCDPDDTNLPYGYAADPEGEPCGGNCLGSSG